VWDWGVDQPMLVSVLQVGSCITVCKTQTTVLYSSPSGLTAPTFEASETGGVVTRAVKGAWFVLEFVVCRITQEFEVAYYLFQVSGK